MNIRYAAWIVVMVVVGAINSTFAQVPDREIRFGFQVPAIGVVFKRQFKELKNSETDIRGEKSNRSLLTEWRRSFRIKRRNEKTVSAVEIELLNHTYRDPESGKVKEQTNPDPRIGRKFLLSVRKDGLRIREGKKDLVVGKGAKRESRAFSREFAAPLARGTVFDPGAEWTHPLKGKSFVLKKTYKNLFGLHPEFQDMFRVNKIYKPESKTSCKTRFLRLTKVDGVDCVVFKTTHRLEMKFKAYGNYIEHLITIDEVVTVAIKTCWHVKTVSTMRRKHTGREKPKDKKPILNSKSTSKATLKTVYTPAPKTGD